MDDPTSGWDTYATDLAEVAWDVGALEIAISSDDTYAYSSRELGGDFGVALAAAEFIPTGAGSAGLLCIGTGEAGADLAHGVVFTQDGAVIFVSIDGGTQEILEVNEGIGTELPEGQSSTYGLACGGTSTGALRLTAFGDGTGPLATYQLNEGAASFSSVAAYGEASTAGFALDVSTVAAYGIPGSTTGMSPEAEELLTHVPPDWQSQCIESPTTESEVAIVVCMLQQDGAGPELAAYSLYESNEAMDAEYQARVSEFGGQTPSGDCREGPNETTWNFEDGAAVGRVQCAPQQFGIRMDWTDDRLQILSNVIDFDGDYATLYEAWLSAGPITAP